MATPSVPTISRLHPLRTLNVISVNNNNKKSWDIWVRIKKVGWMRHYCGPEVRHYTEILNCSLIITVLPEYYYFKRVASTDVAIKLLQATCELLMEQSQNMDLSTMTRTMFWLTGIFKPVCPCFGILLPEVMRKGCVWVKDRGHHSCPPNWVSGMRPVHHSNLSIVADKSRPWYDLNG